MKPDKRSRRTLGSILLALLTQLQLWAIPAFAAATANGSHPEWTNFYDVADKWSIFSIGRQIGQFVCAVLAALLNFIERDVFTAIFANSEVFFENTANHVFGSHANFMSIVSAFLIIGLVSYGIWIILHNEQTSNSARFMTRQIIAFIGVFLLIPGVLGSFWGFLGKNYKADAKSWVSTGGSLNSPSAECMNACITDWYWLAGKGAIDAEKSSDSDTDAGTDAGTDAAATDNTDSKKSSTPKLTKNGDIEWAAVQAGNARDKKNSVYVKPEGFYTCAPETGYIGWSSIDPQQYMTEDGIDDYNNEVKGAAIQQQHLQRELDTNGSALTNHQRRELNAKIAYYGNLQIGADKKLPTEGGTGGLISDDVKNNVFTCDASGNKIKAAQSSSDSGANVVKVLFNHGFGAPPYYRYTIDWIPLIVELFALSVFYLAIAFKILRILFDTLITGIVAPLFVAIDFWGESGQRTKTVYRSIVNAMLSIFALLLEIEFFTFFADNMSALGKGLPWAGRLGVEALGYLALCYIGIKGADIFKKMNLDVDNSMEMSQIAKGGKAVANAAGKVASGAIGFAAGTALAKAGAHEMNKAGKAAKAAKDGQEGTNQLASAANGRNGNDGAAKNPKNAKDGKQDDEERKTALSGQTEQDELTQNNFQDEEEDKGSSLEGNDNNNDENEKALGGKTETGNDNTNGENALEQGQGGEAEGEGNGEDSGAGQVPQTKAEAKAAQKEALEKAAASTAMAAETVAALSQDGEGSDGESGGNNATSDTAQGGAKGTAKTGTGKRADETRNELQTKENGEPAGQGGEAGTNPAATPAGKNSTLNGAPASGGQSEQPSAEQQQEVAAAAAGLAKEASHGGQSNLENGSTSAPVETQTDTGTTVQQQNSTETAVGGEQPSQTNQVGGSNAAPAALDDKSSVTPMPTVNATAKMDAIPVENAAAAPAGGTAHQMAAPQQPSGQRQQAQTIEMGDNAQVNMVAGKNSNISTAGGTAAPRQANVGESYASAAESDTSGGYISETPVESGSVSGGSSGGYDRMTVERADGSRVTFENSAAIQAASGGGGGADSPQISAQSEMANNWGTTMMSGHATGKQAERAASYARMGKQGQRIANVAGHELAWSNNRKMRSNVRKATQQAYVENGGSKAAGFVVGRVKARGESVKSYAKNKVNEYVGYAAGSDRDKSNANRTYADRAQVIEQDTRPQGDNMNNEKPGN